MNINVFSDQIKDAAVLKKKYWPHTLMYSTYILIWFVCGTNLVIISFYVVIISFVCSQNAKIWKKKIRQILNFWNVLRLV